MTLLVTSRSVIAVFFVAVLSFTAAAQVPAPNTTEWENEALKLRLFYPSDLAKADIEQVMRDGKFYLPGIADASDPKLSEITHCLHPVLLLNNSSSPRPQSPATIVLAELDVECVNSKHEGSTTLLNDMAEIGNKASGMKSIASPSTYTIGQQKIHMAAAQMSAPATPAFYFMGISTNWNSHLLVWYFSSGSVEMLNRITKTTVRFGRDQAVPLYPLSIANPTP